MGLKITAPPVVSQPESRARDEALPPIGLIPAGGLSLEKALEHKGAEAVPVHLVFPVGRAQEAGNLKKLLAELQPLSGRLLDRVWIAFGGRRSGGLGRLTEEFPGLTVLKVREHLPPDQRHMPVGKGAAMRALLYHLMVREGLRHPRAVVIFLDADIRPPYFSSRWVVDPVGALLRFRRLEAVKLVYHRPRGGRLNAMLRSLVALCPHPGVQALQGLAYLLSGEMAGTLRFWSSLPFKSGFGVEIFTLLSLALDRLKLAAGRADLDCLAQVHVGRMDHRHAPLTSTARRRGLDQMAATVFHTFLEVMEQEGILCWRPPPGESPTLTIPLPVAPGQVIPDWLTVPIKDETLPPLNTLPEIREQWARQNSGEGVSP